jgi:spore germination cell wall hydrolase CwlJ-like protein
MGASSTRPKGIFSAPFGLSALLFVLIPNQIGHQDLAALIARQPSVTAHWRQHIRASAFGTIHAATFSFSRPIGTARPPPIAAVLASIDPADFMLGSVSSAPYVGPPPLQFPKVDRSAKGDRLRPPQPEIAATQAPVRPEQQAAVSQEENLESSPEQPEVASELPIPEQAEESEIADLEVIPEAASINFPDPVEDNGILDDTEVATENSGKPLMEMARLYFGQEPLGDEPSAMEKWAPGEEPTLVLPQAPAASDIKLAALAPEQPGGSPAEGGETIANKGEVTGEGKRPMTPAERLKLDDKARAKAEKCLANAVYFEARGEAVRGQMAVAQVVMNRVFSGYYPNDVCKAVYQNAHRRLACQFTFACDGIPDAVTEPQAWLRATRIAKDTLDGKYWIPEVDRATHYHAYWVRPSWAREMKKLYKFGVHTFYRPRNWGDGSDAPSWGSAAATAEATAKL